MRGGGDVQGRLSDSTDAERKSARPQPGTYRLFLCQGLFPVGNGHAACGLMDVLAGGKEAAAVALFFAAGFLAAFFAATFFAGAFLAADFFAATFFAVPVLPGAFFTREVFAIAFLAGAFLIATFFTDVFLALVFFMTIFFGADDFFATAFFAKIFFAGAFFAVAISFLLDQSYRSNCLPPALTAAQQHPSPKVYPKGALRCNE